MKTASILVLALAACANTQALKPAPVSVKRADDLRWGPLNPARGDQSPQAANLRGDRNSATASGFLVRFRDGFASPPHIHNVTYRAVVIEGRLHNDDPDAELLWMPPGSFWTQPKGEAHITAAQGPSNVAYVEIESGPYLVAPPTEAFRTGEYPINLHTSNIQWLDQTASPWVRGAEIAFLWGEPRPRALNGTFLRLFAGTAGALEFRGSGDGLLVSGTAQLGGHALKPGDGVSVGTGGASLECATDCLLYWRTNGTYRFDATSAPRFRPGAPADGPPTLPPNLQ